VRKETTPTLGKRQGAPQKRKSAKHGERCRKRGRRWKMRKRITARALILESFLLFCNPCPQVWETRLFPFLSPMSSDPGAKTEGPTFRRWPSVRTNR
jgi:hypothetical protein